MHNLSAKNVFLIAKREYVERVRTKAFLIFTLLMPAVMFGFGVLPSLLAMKKTGGELHIVLVSKNAALAQSVKDEIQRPPSTSEPKQQPTAGTQQNRLQGTDARYTVDLESDTSDQSRSALQQKINNKQIDGFVWLDDKAVTDHTTSYVSRSTSDFVELGRLQSRIRGGVLRYQLTSKGFDQDELKAFLKPFDLNAVKWVGGKESKSEQTTQMIAVIFLVITLYATVLMYGINVMRAVLEEKTSRIMEVLMSSVSSTDLMAGKILGVGAVGLTQVALWVLMATLAAAPGAFSLADKMKDANFSGWTAVFFATFFLLGYFLYASLCAALGAMVNSEQEAQQLQFIIILPLAISIMMMMAVIRQPNDPTMVALSFVPFFTPVMMFIRTMVSEVPAWQIGLSVVTMLLSIAAVVWVCSRIYRVGALMYGKKPTLPEIIKWVRYA
jgi:ABC-2 type transport system permease protein